jgi:threonine synthase
MKYELVCPSCKRVSQEELSENCVYCEAQLKVRYGLSRNRIRTRPECNQAARMWGFRDLLPVLNHEEPVTLGEGMTPMTQTGSTMGDLSSVWLKLEYLNPTCSFKDRTASLLLTKAKSHGMRSVIIDSSGNAAASIAAYAAAVNIACNVFVPSTTSPFKLRQMAAYGASISKIDGTRQEVLEAARDFAKKNGGYYCGFQINPFATEANRTIAYEIAQQLRWHVPDFVFIPMGTGGLLLGCIDGFEELLRLGWTSRIPLVIGVQPIGCAPIVDAFSRRGGIVPIEDPHTVAEGLKIGRPYKGAAVIEALIRVGGEAISVTDDEILRAQELLSRVGFYVEPSGAVSTAGFLKLLKKGDLPRGREAACILTGSGLKTPG